LWGESAGEAHTVRHPHKVVELANYQAEVGTVDLDGEDKDEVDEEGGGVAEEQRNVVLFDEEDAVVFVLPQACDLAPVGDLGARRHDLLVFG
jgi:hypothetical protein